MAGICVTIVLSLVIQLAHGQENIAPVIDLIALTEKEIKHLKVEVQHIETKVINKMRILNLILRTELIEKIVPAYVHSQIEASWTQVLRERSIDSMVNSHVMSQMRQLKQEHQQMKRQIHSLSRHLRTAENTGHRHPPDKSVLRDSTAHQHNVFQTDLNNTNIMISSLQQDVTSLTEHVAMLNHSCQTQATEREKLESAVDKIEMKLDHLETGKGKLGREFHRLNESHAVDTEVVENSHQEYINTTESPEKETCGVSVNDTQELVLTSPPVSPSPSVRTTSPTSHRSKDMTRILVVQRYSNSTIAKQINIQTHAMTKYQYLDPSNIRAFASDPVSRRLIFSIDSSDGIFSSALDAYSFTLTTLKAGVRSYGIAVDVHRRLIFLTNVFRARATISRMSIWGKKFRNIVDVTELGSNSPLGIAVDTRRRMIYFCNYDALWSVSYRGKNVHRIKAGKNILGVTVDIVSNILYFGEGKKVMKLSLATNVFAEIREASGFIFNIISHNNSLYIVTFLESGVDIIHLNDEPDVHFNLEQVKYTYNVMCLLP
ncbi:uncharacterized protein LOC124132205 [Haliotis rufescens]|uniref:uncharacterized protein LOC124132205 n=1 Tax=Haliotis rufescens TaxID=6454 RepID=UPI00201FA4BA|nr:uncharacterized protein LOC124132205 [Haliotis rufescens]